MLNRIHWNDSFWKVENVICETDQYILYIIYVLLWYGPSSASSVVTIIIIIIVVDVVFVQLLLLLFKLESSFSVRGCVWRTRFERPGSWIWLSTSYGDFLFLNGAGWTLSHTFTSGEGIAAPWRCRPSWKAVESAIGWARRRWRSWIFRPLLICAGKWTYQQFYGPQSSDF